MHPTPSIIIFTVSSGAGFGLILLLTLLHGFALADAMSVTGQLSAAVTGFVLIVGGLVASVFHLANPKNAWKAFNRFRTSWLSREGVFSLLFLAVAAAYFAALLAGVNMSVTGMRALAALIMVLGVATLFSTGMIYASLKPIPQWRNPLVPPVYILLGLATGGVILATIEAALGHVPRRTGIATLVVTALAALTKGVYYYWIGHPSGLTINTATGMTQAQVKLFDIGHGHDTFLTTEFGNAIRKAGSRTLRSAFFLFGFLVPALVVALLMEGASVVYGVVGIVAALGGAALERWLFFVEARHTVNLYHGRQRV